MLAEAQIELGEYADARQLLDQMREAGSADVTRAVALIAASCLSPERRVGMECSSRWSPYP